nr:Chain A, CASP8 and FADD-like apoptosis regulator [Homo sapiens]
VRRFDLLKRILK